MDWNNDIVIEFIEKLSKESILWDPKNKNHKNRSLVMAAWVRIQKTLSEHYSVDVLKRKKNSLMTQYRECLRKIRESSKMASRTGEVHQPGWFAFEIMHEFLGEIYQSRLSFNSTEVFLCPEDNELDDQYQNENMLDWPPIREKKVERAISDVSSEHSESIKYLEEPPSPPSPPQLTRRPQIKQACSLKRRLAPNEDNSSSDDECDIYGQLLATKLKKLVHEDRLRLMNDIDNLAYKHMMGATKRYRPSSTSKSSMQ